MLNKNNSELPTDQKTLSRATKLALFNHYINHRINSKKTVLENIISSLSKNYIPERYFLKSEKTSKVLDDTTQDIRSLAYLIVWEAADKYLWGSNKKQKLNIKKINFCVFASEQVRI